MDKQKQIEEMEKVIDNVQTYGTKWYSDKYEPFDCRIENDDIAYELYNAGYRKIPECAVVLTKEELEDMKFTQKYCDLYKENEWLRKSLSFIRNGTAEKFAEMLKELVADRNCNEDYEWEDVQVDGQIFIECVDEIYKEITEGKDE